MSDEQAASLYEKHFDGTTGFFFFVDRNTGETLWNKPPGVPANMPCTTDIALDYEEEAANDYGGTAREATQSYQYSGVEEVPAVGADASTVDTSESSTGDYVEIIIKKDRRRAVGSELSFCDGRGRGGHFDPMSNSFKRHTGRIVPYPWQQSIDFRKTENGTQEPLTLQTPLNGTTTFTYPMATRKLLGARGSRSLPWQSVRRTQPAPSFQFLDQGNVHEGPYCRRAGVGKKMIKSINRLPLQTSRRERVAYSKTRAGDSKKDRVFELAEDVNYTDWEIGQQITLFDGEVERESNLEAMLLGRGAYEDGGEAVARMMATYKDRADVQMFGLINLAKYDYNETAEGFADPDGVAAMHWTLAVMPMYMDNEAIQSRAVVVLAQLADNYAMRRELIKEDWTGKTVAAMNGNRMMTREMVVEHGQGRRERIEVKEPSRFAKETCAWTCKLFALMACDNANRQNVADDGMSVVMHAMKFCPDDPLVQMNGCRAIYNFVYRCEAAHTLAEEEDVLDIVEPILENFTSDKELILTAERTLRALQPDGWRGGADDPNENGAERNFAGEDS